MYHVAQKVRSCMLCSRQPWLEQQVYNHSQFRTTRSSKMCPAAHHTRNGPAQLSMGVTESDPRDQSHALLLCSTEICTQKAFTKRNHQTPDTRHTNVNTASSKPPM